MKKEDFPFSDELLYVQTDTIGLIKNCTEAFKRLVGNYTLPFDETCNITSYLHHGEEKPFTELLSKSSALDKSLYIDIRLRGFSDNHKWYEATVTRAEGAGNNRPINIEFYPIDSRKKESIKLLAAIEREKKLNQMRTAYVSTTSHEFRTPLSIIKSSADVMLLMLEMSAENENTTKFRKYLDTINHESDKLTRLMNDILIMQKAEVDMIECNKAKTNVEVLIANIIERNNLIQQDGRVMELKKEGEAFDVLIDSTLFEYIMDNIFSNAFKYSVGKANPVCTLSFKADGWQVMVVDDGIGIPVADQQNLFASYFRANNVGVIKGTGLGLSIVKKLVKLHDGRVELSSQQNHGTSVTLFFPRL